MSKCKTCKAEVVRAKTRAGKTLTLDAKPHQGGNVFYFGRNPAEELNESDLAHQHALEQQSGITGKLYKTHTCPEATK